MGGGEVRDIELSIEKMWLSPAMGINYFDPNNLWLGLKQQTFPGDGDGGGGGW